MEYDMQGYMAECLETYTSLTGVTKFRTVETPFLDEKAIPTSEFEDEGILATSSSKYTMKILFAARVCRWDLLRIITLLAGCATKWSTACDRLCYRMTCYIYSSMQLRLYTVVADPASEWEIHAF